MLPKDLSFGQFAAEGEKFRFADDENTPSPMTLTQLTSEVRVSPLDEFLYNTLSQLFKGLRMLPLFCIKVRALDNTDCGTMVIFDNDASLLIHKSCQAVLDSIPRDLMPKFGEAVVSCDEKSPSDSQAKRTSPVNLDDDDMDLPLKLLKRKFLVVKAQVYS
ncbi:hypothetical protein TSUD_137610 [Trifolium subterraneum]|uniref:Uncharacterized protein n=1 Tax=Trifolium subterraneum TaxID=3900 RepID=A0A2Z6PM16_TRISU|nr:hypothetical protein TSUD_137610 [Trifolium subterraneum]